MVTALWAILIFCVLIFVHEFGHYITAKLSGMTVHEFSIGMGPKIFGFSKKGTMYSIRILPLGGFVKLEGEDGESDDRNAFCNKSALRRFAVLFAGAFMNIILGFVIFVIIFSNSKTVSSNVVGDVLDGSPFYEAGIESGDKIVSMKGDKFSTSVHTFRDINLFVNINGAIESDITFERKGKKFSKKITPSTDIENGRIIFGMIPAPLKNTLWNVLSLGFWECIFVIKSVLLSLWWLFTGAIPPSSMSGPVAIVGEIGSAAKIGLSSVAYLSAFISVNLGVMNLLPIPALDGGRILFLIIEKIRGKKMNSEKEGMINFIFFALLIFLMLFVTFSDIKKLF